MDKRQKLYDTVITVIIIAVSVYVLIVSSSFKRESGLFPVIVSSTTLFLCILQLISGIREYIKQKDVISISAITSQRFIIATTSLILYIALIFVLGYYCATIAYLCCSIYLLGYRKKIFVACISIGMLLFVYILFELVLHVNMPGSLLTV